MWVSQQQRPDRHNVCATRILLAALARQHARPEMLVHYLMLVHYVMLMHERERDCSNQHGTTAHHDYHGLSNKLHSIPCSSSTVTVATSMLPQPTTITMACLTNCTASPVHHRHCSMEPMKCTFFGGHADMPQSQPLEVMQACHNHSLIIPVSKLITVVSSPVHRHQHVAHEVHPL